MELPKTTEKEPYIQFVFHNNGKLELSTSSSWWGGINGGFTMSGGAEGNTCLPKDLPKFIRRFRLNAIKKLEKEILKMQRQVEKLKKEHEKNSGLKLD